MEEQEKADGISLTVMSLREVIMEYFKGTCVEHVIVDNPAQLHELSQNTRGLSRSERWRLQYKRPAILLLDLVPIATLGQEPHTITIHTEVMGRSPQLRKVKDGLEKFLRTYLPNVRIKHRKGGVFYGQ